MTWNVLAQSLSYIDNNFSRVKDEWVNYETRKWKVLKEIKKNNADICVLQEVDFFDDFLKDEVKKIGYACVFAPKPDSPCLKIEGNMGPDGIVICYKDNMFKRTECTSYLLYPGKGAQVYLVLKLNYIYSSTPIIVIGLHLKAKESCANIRVKQISEVIEKSKIFNSSNIIIAGDFNGGTNELFNKMLNDEGYINTYKCLGADLKFTMWKYKMSNDIEKERKDIQDYIFFKGDDIIPFNYLSLPLEKDIGDSALPSESYPSDHISLKTTFLVK